MNLGQLAGALMGTYSGAVYRGLASIITSILCCSKLCEPWTAGGGPIGQLQRCCARTPPLLLHLFYDAASCVNLGQLAGALKGGCSGAVHGPRLYYYIYSTLQLGV